MKTLTRPLLRGSAAFTRAFNRFSLYHGISAHAEKFLR